MLGNDTVNHITGLKPDTFTFRVYRFEPDVGAIPQLTLKASLGQCGSNLPPVTATPPTTQPPAPRGALVQKAGRRMQAIANNTKVDYTSAFRVTMNPPRGLTVTRSFYAGARKMSYHAYAKRPKGTKYTLKAKVKVRSSTGSLTWAWKKLAYGTVR